MAVGKAYRSHTRSSQANKARFFDAIVIGSGMGGLSTASFLAQAAKRVLVLEQHKTIGGFTHSFARGSYRWDVGLHYVGQVHVQGSLLNKVFRYITNNKLQWEPLDDIYDRAIFCSMEYDFP
ncbi:NAD(P)-binding protein [bacterium]|nr:NAD(P)-binding protein [bacterium]MDB4631649.1 NAD(P)-binding protein [Pseudomonadales bacterium]